MNFTYDSYKNMVRLLQEGGYIICGYDDYEEHDKCAILRHDVDFSLEKALTFAELESDLGVNSTYFVLLSTDLYNVASAKNVKILKKIKGMGHSIGLHFDEMKYRGFSKNIQGGGPYKERSNYTF